MQYAQDMKANTTSHKKSKHALRNWRVALPSSSTWLRLMYSKSLAYIYAFRAMSHQLRLCRSSMTIDTKSWLHVFFFVIIHKTIIYMNCHVVFAYNCWIIYNPISAFTLFHFQLQQVINDCDVKVQYSVVAPSTGGAAAVWHGGRGSDSAAAKEYIWTGNTFCEKFSG